MTDWLVELTCRFFTVTLKSDLVHCLIFKLPFSLILFIHSNLIGFLNFNIFDHPEADQRGKVPRPRYKQRFSTPATPFSPPSYLIVHFSTLFLFIHTFILLTPVSSSPFLVSIQKICFHHLKLKRFDRNTWKCIVLWFAVAEVFGDLWPQHWKNASWTNRLQKWPLLLPLCWMDKIDFKAHNRFPTRRDDSVLKIKSFKRSSLPVRSPYTNTCAVCLPHPTVWV